MNKDRILELCAGVVLAIQATAVVSAGYARAQTISLMPATVPRIGAVEERYQSYNIEMIEVTGGSFWKPYGSALDAVSGRPAPLGGNTLPGMNPALFQYRPPIDLSKARLRKLALALGPAYVRVSGSWANTTYFSDTDQAYTAPPAGFIAVLTRPQWKGFVEFATAADAEIVASFANGIGTRDAVGAWTTEQAKRLVDYTTSLGGRLAAAEFMNEPTMGGEPVGYDAAAYGRDFKVFHAFVRQAAPDMLILGPDAVGETTGEWGVANAPMLKTRDLLAASQPAAVDAFSYHHYGALSQRCAGMGVQTTAEAALTEDWLRRTDETLAFYRKLRDEFEPGKPLWLTETADAACGGNPWASTFIDTFRYLDQLGRLAKQGVKVVAHNTLVGSDYGLVNEQTLEPRPNYWGALLWRRLMGAAVLDAGSSQPGLHLYTHCLRDHPGGITLLAINTDRIKPESVYVPIAAERYTLTSHRLEEARIQLNDYELALEGDDELPNLQGVPVPPGNVDLAPTSITFLAIAGAKNNSCQ